MPITQEQFLNNLKTKIYQYLYRNFDISFDNIIRLLQEISLNNNLNWQEQANKDRLKNIFTALNSHIDSYNINDGDFRTYLLLKFVDTVYLEFQNELFTLYVQEGYNVTPESVVGSLDSAYSIAPPQNTNFPGTSNTSNIIEPIPDGVKLIPNALYNHTSDLD